MMEDNHFTPLTVASDYFQQWYQSNQQHPQAQLTIPYQSMAHYTEESREEPVMTELSVHWEPPHHHETVYLNCNHLGHDQILKVHQNTRNEQQPQYMQEHQRQLQPTLNCASQLQHTETEPVHSLQTCNSVPHPAEMVVKRKRGRPPKQNAEETLKQHASQEEPSKKARRSLNRFGGMSLAEVMAKTLPDVITYNLDILIIGINPGLLSAYKGRHYPNPGNHFWKCLFLSGLTKEQLNFMHDQTLPEKYSIGFTNMVERTTPGSKDLSNKEIREGGRDLLCKLQKFKPLIAAFNGKGIYEIFCKEIFGVKAKNLDFGLQPYKVPETSTVCFLMPSSSPRCAQFPRAQDKVHFYIKLKELRDQMKGIAPILDVRETNYTFDLQLAKEDALKVAIKEEQMDPEYESCSQSQQL
ncbi:G/T mismatch-specific thymine DNA glycosylase isoform X1 [Synchiropus splendidus]|uniref:G/T mismatch-specific thymine DNA glycosylase isoform X1 n=2 Tax=Synchiropus splendidus TaxID=270530 RepID=UPI00237D3A52|nr:G/T mismatch-specific thymine DNA glycosylase isoform X1 [Synchiropus splendidus]